MPACAAAVPRLTLLLGRAEEVLPRFVHSVAADAVYASTDIERWSGQVRDRTLAQIAAAEGWQVRWFLNYYVQTEASMTARRGRMHGRRIARRRSSPRPITFLRRL